MPLELFIMFKTIHPPTYLAVNTPVPNLNQNSSSISFLYPYQSDKMMMHGESLCIGCANQNLHTFMKVMPLTAVTQGLNTLDD